MLLWCLMFFLSVVVWAGTGGNAPTTFKLEPSGAKGLGELAESELMHDFDGAVE